MGLFTRGLGKPGKGIDANAPEKRSFFRFFDIFFRKFWHFVRLNILYVVMCIPTFIIIFVLSSLISNSFFDASGVIDTLNSVGESMAAASESGTTAEMYTSRLVVFFDVLIRFGFSFLFMAFWGMGPVSAGLAYVLRNTLAEFSVWYDETTKAISLSSNSLYVPVGGEMEAGEPQSQGVPSSSKMYIDGIEYDLEAYNIGGNNYFKLRDLGEALNFFVGYDPNSRTVIIMSMFQYSDEQ